jgi:hypothetical protein
MRSDVEAFAHLLTRRSSSGKAGGVRTGSWKEAIQHDGYLVVRLRVFTLEEGGQNRHIQSGMRASWDGPDHRLLPGLLELASESERSIAPGVEALVHVRPLEPSSWKGVDVGTRISLCKNWPRALGEGVVVERVGVPEELVPPRFPSPRGGTPAVARLQRRTTIGERALLALRRLRDGRSSPTP